MKIKRILWLCLGCIGLVLGALGAVLPLLPTVPFLLLAALGFAKSSERLHTWFTGTKLYKNNLESYVRGEGMTAAAKRRIMLTVTALMARRAVNLTNKHGAGIWGESLFKQDSPQCLQMVTAILRYLGMAANTFSGRAGKWRTRAPQAL